MYGLFMLNGFGIWITIFLWPIIIPFTVIDNAIQERELNNRRNQEEPQRVDMGREIGKLGETLTAQSPTGRVWVDGKEYESRSTRSFISKGKKIRVVGHSMDYLQIEGVDSDITHRSDRSRRKT